MIKRILLLAAAGYAVWCWQSRKRCIETGEGCGPHPEEVTTWEGEGGALPESGAQLGPEPATR